MPRLMSVAFTEQAVIQRRKTVTRRKGWWEDRHGRRILNPGDLLLLCRKVQGRRPGEPLVRLAEVRVIDVRREPLAHITDQEIALEGFPGMSRDEFMHRFFVEAQGIRPDDLVTRIEWEYLDETLQPNHSLIERRVRFNTDAMADTETAMVLDGGVSNWVHVWDSHVDQFAEVLNEAGKRASANPLTDAGGTPR